MIHLIFDFDGTLVDSLDKTIDIFNILADKFNFGKISKGEVAELKNLSSKELIKHLKIPFYKIPKVLSKARKQMSGEIEKLTPFANIPPVLKKMHEANFSLGILTSNSEENVSVWLRTHKMQDLFNFIHIEPNYFGKTHLIKKILKKYGMNKREVFYIGDETRDIDAAKQNQICSVAVTWGFNSEEILLQYKPHYIAKIPEDLLTLCGL